MALTASPAPPNWGRWSQQLPHDFSMMDAPGFMPYDTRGNPPHMPRPMAPQYVVGPPYNTAPMQTMPAPQYQPQNTYNTYTPYHSPPPSTSAASPYKPDFHDRSHRSSLASNAEVERIAAVRRGSRQLSDVRLQSPARSESNASTARSSISIPTANSKTITYNETLNPADRVSFETDVDELMKAIQAKSPESEDGARQTLTPAHTPRADACSDAQSPACSFRHASTPVPELKQKKKWICDGPNCNKRFVQKTHLDIHRRTHNGLKPYVCTKDNCGLTFSQRGNLKTHMRRHTGEKPYSCSICGKTFAQRGNVRSHEETHKGLKPFVCKLDDCNKTFSQLGNMKTHQNNFHKETLKGLTNMFVKFARMGEVPEEHRELFDYFKEHYKNSNKGIKGRGKARTVAVRKPKNSSNSSSTQPPVPMVTDHFSQPPGSMSNPGSAYIPRTFGVYESSHDQNGATGMLYEDEHARQMAFGNRIY